MTMLVPPRADIPIVIGRDVNNRAVLLDANFSRMFLQPLYLRVGGVAAPSNDQLLAQLTALAAVVAALQASVDMSVSDLASEIEHIETGEMVFQAGMVDAPLEMTFQA